MAKQKNLNWVRVGQFGMQADSYRCGKVFLDGATLYQVWHDYTLLKTCADWDQAQKVAEAHRRGEDYETL